LFFETDDHIVQYASFNIHQINQILQNVLDVETLFGLILKEDDADTKQIYYFLFKLLRKGILSSIDLNKLRSGEGGGGSSSLTPSQNNSFNSETSQSNVKHGSPNHNHHQNNTSITTSTSNFKNSPMSVEAHLGKPPFEEPSITRAIINFLFLKYGKSGDSELKSMLEVTKLFLYCLNMWKFETPTSFSKRIADSTSRLFNELNSDAKNADGTTQSSNALFQKQQKIIALYKLNYTRWMCYNFVPSFCDSLEKYETIAIFGISFLKLVLPLIRQELQDKFIGEKEKMPGENRLIFSTNLPR
jgi:hypothetical protein